MAALREREQVAHDRFSAAVWALDQAEKASQPLDSQVTFNCFRAAIDGIPHYVSVLVPPALIDESRDLIPGVPRVDIPANSFKINVTVEPQPGIWTVVGQGLERV